MHYNLTFIDDQPLPVRFIRDGREVLIERGGLTLEDPDDHNPLGYAEADFWGRWHTEDGHLSPGMGVAEPFRWTAPDEIEICWPADHPGARRDPNRLVGRRIGESIHLVIEHPIGPLPSGTRLIFGESPEQVPAPIRIKPKTVQGEATRPNE